MSTKVGSIHYELDLDDDSFNKKTDQASNKWGSLGSKISGVGAGVAKATGAALLAAGTAIAGITVASLKSYADYEQFTGGIQKLFGDTSDTVIKNAQKAYKTAGMDANNYMQTVTGFSARLLQSLGGDTEKAANIADTAIKDMSDNANTFGTDMESIKTAYQGFAKANYTMLDNLKLGFGGTASEMARLVNESGVMGDTFVATAQNINEVGFDKIIEAIHVTQEELKITGTTATEASQTISGSVNAMKGAWGNLLTSFASGDIDAISVAMEGLGDSIGDVFTNISTVIPKIIEGMVGAISQLPKLDLSGIITKIVEQIPMLVELAVSLVKELVEGIKENLPMIVTSAMAIITTLVIGLTDLLPMILTMGIELIVSLLQGIAEALPELIPAIIDAVILMVTTLVENLPLIIEAGLEIIVALIRGLVEALPTLIQFIPSIIGSIVTVLNDSLPLIVIAALQIILALAKGLIIAIPQLVVAVPQIVLAIVKALAKSGKSMQEAGKELVAGLWNGITNSMKWFKDKITGWVGDVMKFIKRLFGISSPSKLMEGEVGFNLGSGIASGIMKSIDLVENAMGAIGDTVEASVSPLIEPTLDMDRIPSVMQRTGLNALQGGSGDTKTVNQDIDINIDKINDNQDLNALANQLGFRASLLPI